MIQTKSYDPVIYKRLPAINFPAKYGYRKRLWECYWADPDLWKTDIFWWSDQHKIIQGNIIFLILKTVEQFKEVLQRPVKKFPSLRDVTIVNLYYENSTRTSERKSDVLIDNILYNERTIRAALDALFDFGRPEKGELCVLIDRRFSHQLPIQPDYIGKSIDAIVSQKEKVFWKNKDGKDEVCFMND